MCLYTHLFCSARLSAIKMYTVLSSAQYLDSSMYIQEQIENNFLRLFRSTSHLQISNGIRIADDENISEHAIECIFALDVQTYESKCGFLS